jgi:hypothetical protein
MRSSGWCMRACGVARTLLRHGDDHSLADLIGARRFAGTAQSFATTAGRLYSLFSYSSRLQESFALRLTYGCLLYDSHQRIGFCLRAFAPL